MSFDGGIVAHTFVPAPGAHINGDFDRKLFPELLLGANWTPHINS